VLCFLFTEMAPGSFFDEMRVNPQISPETIAALHSRYGLDQPLIVRYGRWFRAALHGDLGYSIAYNLPVAPLLWGRAQNTLLLSGTAMFLTWLIAVPVGVWTAARHGKVLDKATNLAGSVLISVPEVVIAVALLAIAVRWRVVPIGGMKSEDIDGLPLWMRIKDVAAHMLLPLIVLILVDSALVVRHVRAAVLEVLDAPFVQAARGFGISRSRLLFRHVFPAISLFGLSLAGLLSGSLLVEVICGWPGLGPMILDATLSRDFYLVVGGIMVSTLFLLGGNLLADMVLLVADPRIRTGVPDAL
jgi:peptide/nickel transport system permease protein